MLLKNCRFYNFYTVLLRLNALFFNALSNKHKRALEYMFILNILLFAGKNMCVRFLLFCMRRKLPTFYKREWEWVSTKVSSN